ncbi:hypothetical protein [Altererythrobacter sp. Root672]|uniref:hypothetical protein n=1 Tax=Altererythrobacter sp. Root672 TaxID=1736584 RepID=UPI0006F2AFCA|nr:hypothetical protein [Altererythrobacter sp. Root672]KRA81268.1 hypothetical protein ASD76_11850 [Altererythrobacter sp. Root672]
MRTLWLALLGVSVCAAVPSAAQTAPKSVQLSKVVVDTATSPIQMRVKGGTLCVFPSNIDLPKEKKTQDNERYDNLFSAEIKGRGFAVTTAAGDLFASESEVKGDYLLGATVVPSTINVCSSVNGVKGSIAVNVEWQIYDRAAQKVVETIETQGEGTLAKFSVSGFEELWDLAFVSALQNLAEKKFFQKYVGEPSLTPVASSSPPQALAN